jgi:hypothetical protein
MSYMDQSPTHLQDSDLDRKIIASVDHICSELNLSQPVRSRCMELLNYLKPGSGYGRPKQMPESLANAVACALVSIAHEEAWRMHRVPRHLPDRFIGGIYGLSSSAVVYNKHLISSVIIRNKVSDQSSNNAHHKLRTLR